MLIRHELEGKLKPMPSTDSGATRELRQLADSGWIFWKWVCFSMTEKQLLVQFPPALLHCLHGAHNLLLEAEPYIHVLYNKDCGLDRGFMTSWVKWSSHPLLKVASPRSAWVQALLVLRCPRTHAATLHLYWGRWSKWNSTCWAELLQQARNWKNEFIYLFIFSCCPRVKDLAWFFPRKCRN